MDLKIISKKQDPLLSRAKVEAEIAFEKATPSRAEIKSRLAKDLGKDEKLIAVKGIYTDYGLKKARNVSYVYEDEDSLKGIEPKIKEKSGGKKKGAKEDAKDEAEKKQETKKAGEQKQPEKQN